MAIAKNTAQRVYGDATPTITITSVDCTGADRYLVVVCVSPIVNESPTSVVFNGSESLTKIAEHTTTATPEGQPVRTSVWTLLAPSATTANIVITQPTNPTTVGCMAQCYTGVDQTTPYGSVSTAEEPADSGGVAPSLVVAGTATGELCVVGLGLGRLDADTARTPGTGVTEEIGFGSNDYAGHALWTKAGAATNTTVDGTLGVNTSWRLIGIALKPVAAGGGQPTGRRLGMVRDAASRRMLEIGREGVTLMRKAA